MKNWNAEAWALFILVSTIPFVFVLITVARIIVGERAGAEIIELITNLMMVIVGGALGHIKAKQDNK